MKKEELESILSDGSGDLDLGPIDGYLHALATERQLPVVAIGICTARIEEAGPALRAVLTRAADGEALSEDEATLCFRGLYILGGARDTGACQPLLRFLRRPHDEIEFLLGDAVTQSLARIVAGVFDGDADVLFSVIADRSIDEFVRDALLGAAAFLTWVGRIERGRMQSFLHHFYDEYLAEDDDYIWIGWLQAIALLGLRDLAPLVHRAWDEGRIPDGILDRHHFEKDLSDAESMPDDVNRFDHANLGYIDDVLVALEWTDRTEDSADELDGGQHWPDMAPYLNQPITNPWRHVGRNDPCPCGSGKKAKRCCLGN